MAKAADRNFDDIASFTRSGAAGEVIFKEGDKSAQLFIVQDGRIELLRGPAGAVVGVVDEGDVFGEWSFFEGKPRDVTARAQSDFRLVVLDRGAYDQVTQEAPEIALWLLPKIARRMHSLLSAQTGGPAAAVPAAAPAAAAVAPPAAVEKPAAPKPQAAPQAPRGDAVLVEEASKTSFTLSAAESIVGRLDRATGFTPEVNLTPLDTERTLSRRHAKILKRANGYFVREDTASRNGTFVNGQRLSAGTDVELHHGDEVRFGLVKTLFKWQ